MLYVEKKEKADRLESMKKIKFVCNVLSSQNQLIVSLIQLSG